MDTHLSALQQLRVPEELARVSLARLGVVLAARDPDVRRVARDPVGGAVLSFLETMASDASGSLVSAAASSLRRGRRAMAPEGLASAIHGLHRFLAARGAGKKSSPAKSSSGFTDAHRAVLEGKRPMLDEGESRELMYLRSLDLERTPDPPAPPAAPATSSGASTAGVSVPNATRAAEKQLAAEAALTGAGAPAVVQKRAVEETLRRDEAAVQSASLAYLVKNLRPPGQKVAAGCGASDWREDAGNAEVEAERVRDWTEEMSGAGIRGSFDECKGMHHTRYLCALSGRTDGPCAGMSVEAYKVNVQLALRLPVYSNPFTGSRVRGCGGCGLGGVRIFPP